MRVGLAVGISLGDIHCGMTKTMGTWPLALSAARAFSGRLLQILRQERIGIRNYAVFADL
jgi:hypothetical protein